MKRLVCLVMFVVMLAGCGKNSGLDNSLHLRNTILQAYGCSFTTEITADYDQKQYTFTIACHADSMGAMSFRVVAPETISGISGIMEDAGGKLNFDDTVLTFPLLADGLLTPVCAPWLFLHCLRSGYINGCEDSVDGTRIIIHDSYQQTPVEVHVYCKEDVPYFAEIFWDGRRIVTLQISDFQIL